MNRQELKELSWPPIVLFSDGLSMYILFKRNFKKINVKQQNNTNYTLYNSVLLNTFSYFYKLIKYKLIYMFSSSFKILLKTFVLKLRCKEDISKNEWFFITFICNNLCVYLQLIIVWGFCNWCIHTLEFINFVGLLKHFCCFTFSKQFYWILQMMTYMVYYISF